MEHLWTDLFTPDEVIGVLKEFIDKWKISNFMRRQNTTLVETLTEREMAAATSGKLNQTYILFRGFRNFVPGEFYSDKYLSSWSTDINVSRRFGPCVVSIEVPCTSVFLDLEYLNHDREHEVLLLPGHYAPVIVENGQDFVNHVNQNNTFIAASIDDMKMLCLELNIDNVSHLNRNQLIDRVRQHRQTNLSHTVRSAHTAAKALGLA